MAMESLQFRKRDWSLDDWRAFWDEGNIFFQSKECQPELLKLEKLLLPLAGKSYRVLVPLCGKAVDMKWLADKGHSVIGVDCSETALISFFNEQGLEYTTKDEGEFKVLTSTSANCDISCYAGDFLALSKAKFAPCDAVWDYGSFIAIKPDQRKKYAEAILGKATSDVNYLLVAFNFDGFALPPAAAYHTTPDAIRDTFGETFKITELPDSERERSVLGKGLCMENYYHLTRA